MTITRQMPTASRGEPEINSITFAVVTHIIVTLRNAESRYNYVATVITEQANQDSNIYMIAYGTNSI